MSDKPAHILEIPASLGRDVDACREGRGPAPPMEAFMSDATLEQAERQTAAAAAPVHAEDLKPISRAEAAARTTFDGEHLPSLPATRRVIPAPFRRPRIAVDHHGKTWQSCRADQVAAGDIVPGLGRVTDCTAAAVRETVAGVEGVAVAMNIVITGAGGAAQSFAPHSQVRVFRREA